MTEEEKQKQEEIEIAVMVFEQYGRSIIKRNIDKILKPEAKVNNIFSTPIDWPVDICVNYEYKGKEGNIGIEVKNWSKCCTYMLTPSPENGEMTHYTVPDSFMIKSDKLKGMNKFFFFNNLDYLLYCCIYKGNIYLYNVRDMEYSELPQCYNFQKKTQANKDSEWVYSYTYFFPLENADKIIHIYDDDENETEN